jgi:hypothetical protein
MPASALAFSPLGLSKAFTAATVAPTSVQGVPTDTTRSAFQYRVANSGAVVVLLGVAASDAAAQTAAASLAAGAIPLLPGAVEVLSLPANSYFSGTTASGTAVVYVTPGEGL